MKNNILLFILCVSINLVYAQPHTNWINYSFSQRVTYIDINEEDVWISTMGGGLVKYNKETGKTTHYNRANSNIPDNNLVGVSVVENGDVWVSSRRYGIGELSNSTWTIYNQSNSGLPFDQLNSRIKIDREGNVWIASFRWMVKFDGFEWKTWITGSNFSPFPIVSDFVFDDNNIVWICSTDGLGKIENGEYSVINGIYGSTNHSLQIDDNGDVWIAQEGRGIYKYDGTFVTHYHTDNSCLSTNIIYAIDFDSERNMWLATSEGLISFDTETCEVYQPERDDRLMLTLRCDENNVIWCGTHNGKLLKFDGSEFSTIELSNSPIKSNYAYPLFSDDENNDWIASSENTVISTSSGLKEVFNKEATSGLQDSNGAIWLAFSTGDICLLQINGNERLVFNSTNSPFNTSEVSISHINIDKHNNLWISTNGHGLFKYDGANFVNYTTENSALPSNTVFRTECDKVNNLWGGTANGLFKFDGINWEVWNTENSFIPTNLVNRLITDSEDNIWFACMDEDRIVGGEFGGGLTKFDGQTMTSYNMANSGLLANTIFGILNDGDKLWLATYGAGLMSFDKKDKWEVYDVTNSGIADNRVQGVIKGRNGNIWMGHNDAGISVFNPDSAIQTVGIINKRLIEDKNYELKVYPNPVKNELFVSINLPDEKIIRAEIYDIRGRLIQVEPEPAFNNNGSGYSFQIQPVLPDKQVLILRLITNKSKIISGKFLYAK